MSEALRLFLIEDDDDIALLIRRSLERADHQVQRCRAGVDALIVLAQAPFDLVVLDWHLPDMNGMEVLARLAADGITVPVLMITGQGDEQLATRALHAGALDYIVKDRELAFLGDLPKRAAESVRRHRLEQSNRLLVQALDSARDGVMVTDLQGTIVRVNSALQEITGYSSDELLGQTPRLLKSGAHPAEVYACLWQTVLNRGSWQGELTNRRKDGQLVQTSMTVSPIVDPQGRLTHFVGIMRDVTDHKRLQHQLIQAQKMQSVGTLAGGIAHEFNNLLAGINGYASLGLREGGVTPTLRTFLQNIVDLSDRAATLTRQLLAFARKSALVRQRTDLLGLLRNTAVLVGRTLHVEVELDLPEGGEAGGWLVEADANQLQQAVVNLALNARDAVHARGPRPAPAPPSIVFRLRAATLASELVAFPQAVPAGTYLVVEVADEGVGMGPSVLNQALDPFYTTKEVGQGTGLGLPMVFGIIQGHQGHLTIDSEVGLGTRVRLYLPRSGSAGPTAPSAPGDELVVEPEQLTGRSILVIDDEEAVLDVVRRFLEIAGHQVAVASSGWQALAKVEAGLRVDLAILDLMMPRENTQTVYQRLRQLCPGVAVLLCTGLAEAEPAPALLRQPGTTLLRKPFRMGELWDAVNQALGDGVPPGERA